MLDHEHVREKMKELKEKELEWETKKELRRQTQADIDELQKKLSLLNSELKTKQALLKRFSDKSGNMHSLESLRDELAQRDTQLAVLEDRLVVLDHQAKLYADTKAETVRLTKVEADFISLKDETNSLNNTCMLQEESIGKQLDENQRQKD